MIPGSRIYLPIQPLPPDRQSGFNTETQRREEMLNARAQSRKGAKNLYKYHLASRFLIALIDNSAFIASYFYHSIT
jgi:hypothetical protein